VVHVLRYEQLGSAGKATVAALRGAMLLEYGYTGQKLGLQFLQKALELDPDYWEWNLYCGKVMSRVRRMEKFRGEEPGEEEVRGILNTHGLTLQSRGLLQKQHISFHLWKPLSLLPSSQKHTTRLHSEAYRSYNKFLTTYGNHKFIVIFTKAHC